MTRTINCIKHGENAEGLDSPPWPGELGQRIFESVSKQAWHDWLGQQTILINENRLSPLNPEHKKYLTAQMEAYLFGDGIKMPDEWQAEK